MRFTPVGAGGDVRSAVGGFLRYVQHRDLHPTGGSLRSRPEVAGLTKYIAYRDAANARADLFGPAGTVGSDGRRQFAAFVAASVGGSRPQLCRGRDGQLRDRRRAVYRMVISPERAAGLDLRRLAQAAVERLESESGGRDLKWIAAVHRNTAHHHVHLVIAGMHEDGAGGFTRIDLTKGRLAAMKEALRLEIDRQRSQQPRVLTTASTLTAKPVPAIAEPLRPPTDAALAIDRIRRPRQAQRRSLHAGSVVIAFRRVAQRYQRQMQHELEEGYRHSQLEVAA